jgi:uncharacterized protein (DUF1330 family)
MDVEPTAADVARLLAEDDGGPVVMLNLLRYAGAEGRESYSRYAQAVVPELERVGAQLLYAGDCSTLLVAPAGHAWDAVLVVRYPSRRAFLEMVTDPSYQAIAHLRGEGLEAAVLEATKPWGA